VVVDPGATELKQNQLLNEEGYTKAREEPPDTGSAAQMGAEERDQGAVEARQRRPPGRSSLARKLKTVVRRRKSSRCEAPEVTDSLRKSRQPRRVMDSRRHPGHSAELRPLVPLDGGVRDWT